MTVTEYLESKTFKTCLYIIVAILIIYVVYTTFFAEEDSDSEEFDNNSSVRSDAGGDRVFDKLSIKEQVQYLQEKQKSIVNNSRAE